MSAIALIIIWGGFITVFLKNYLKEMPKILSVILSAPHYLLASAIDLFR